LFPVCAAVFGLASHCVSSCVQGDADTLRAVLGIVTAGLEPTNPPAVLRVGVAYIGKCLHKYGEALGDAYVKALLKVPADARLRLLDPLGSADELPVTTFVAVNTL
jgi:hypothetical protein